MGFEPDAGIGEQPEADGMGFGKAVECKGLNGRDDAVLDIGANLVFAHGVAQFCHDLGHALGRTVEAHGAAQIFGLGNH